MATCSYPSYSLQFYMNNLSRYSYRSIQDYISPVVWKYNQNHIQLQTSRSKCWLKSIVGLTTDFCQNPEIQENIQKMGQFGQNYGEIGKNRAHFNKILTHISGIADFPEVWEPWSVVQCTKWDKERTTFLPTCMTGELYPGILLLKRLHKWRPNKHPS